MFLDRMAILKHAFGTRHCPGSWPTQFGASTIMEQIHISPTRHYELSPWYFSQFDKTRETMGKPFFPKSFRIWTKKGSWLELNRQLRRVCWRESHPPRSCLGVPYTDEVLRFFMQQYHKAKKIHKTAKSILFRDLRRCHVCRRLCIRRYHIRAGGRLSWSRSLFGANDECTGYGS